MSARAASKQVILKIGYDEILLPDDVGVAAVLKCLSRGMKVRDHTYRGEIMVQNEHTVEVSMSYVTKKVKYVNEAGEDLQPKTPVRRCPELKAPKLPSLEWKGQQRLFP